MTAWADTVTPTPKGFWYYRGNDTPHPYSKERSDEHHEREDLHRPGHDLRALRAVGAREVEELAGVSSVEADRTTGRLVVRGEAINDAAVRAAVGAAGYQVAA